MISRTVLKSRGPVPADREGRKHRAVSRNNLRAIRRFIHKQVPGFQVQGPAVSQTTESRNARMAALDWMAETITRASSGDVLPDGICLTLTAPVAVASTEARQIRKQLETRLSGSELEPRVKLEILSPSVTQLHIWAVIRNGPADEFSNG